MDYNVNVQQAGIYDVSFRVSSPSGASSAIQLKSGATVLATINVPATGAWQTWQTTSGTVTLSSGQQTLRVYANEEGWDLNWFEFTAITLFTPTPSPTPTPYTDADTIADADTDAIPQADTTNHHRLSAGIVELWDRKQSDNQ